MRLRQWAPRLLRGDQLDALGDGRDRGLWVPIIRSWALTRGFALHPGTRNRYEIRYTRTQHRPPSRQVNDHGRVSENQAAHTPATSCAEPARTRRGRGMRGLLREYRRPTASWRLEASRAPLREVCAGTSALSGMDHRVETQSPRRCSLAGVGVAVLGSGSCTQDCMC